MWALTAAVFHVRGYPLLEGATATFFLCALYAPVCGSSYYMARAMKLSRKSILSALASLVAASALGGLLWAALAYAASLALPGPPGRRLSEQLWLLFGMGAGFFLLSVIYHYLVVAVEEAGRAERSIQRARLAATEAELRALRAHIKPHFLFNALNSVASLITIDPDEARRMCALLSDFLRASMRRETNRTITLREELALVRSYLEIERVRFQDRMKVDERIQEESLEAHIPPLLLQPLVENAVKHGVAGASEGATIRLEAKLSHTGGLQMTLTNPCDPDREENDTGMGHGLFSVKSRLRALYGERASMMVQTIERQFVVELEVPDKP
jgi:hypothetical protein